MPRAVRDRLTAETAGALHHARSMDLLVRSARAEQLWREVYPALTAGHPGLHGALLARGPAHVVRLSELFALLALSNSIKAAHLESALAWWDYNVKSVQMIFSDRTGNADADRIEAELLPGEKLDLQEIRERLFSNHISSGRLHDALAEARRGRSGERRADARKAANGGRAPLARPVGALRGLRGHSQGTRAGRRVEKLGKRGKSESARPAQQRTAESVQGSERHLLWSLSALSARVPLR